MSDSIQSIINADIVNASSGGSPPEDLIGQICYYTSVEMDLAKANFLRQSATELDKILDARLHVLNGEYKQVQQIIKDLNQLENDDAKVEYCLAEAQTLCHLGQWVGAISIAEKGLSLGPTNVTKISLIQCRAFALYEIGDFQKALKDCEMVLSQKNLYERAIAIKYAKVLKIKILNAMGRMQEAEYLFQKMFNFSESAPLDLDLLLSLLRIKIDIYRSKSRSIHLLANACREVAQRLQDPLYVSMAEFDFYTGVQAKGSLAPEPLVHSANNFEKIEIWQKKFDEKRADFTSEKRHLLTKQNASGFKMAAGIQFVITSEGYVIDLENLKVCKLNLQGKLSLLIETLANGPVTRKRFFEGIWQQKYNYEKHDGVIRSFLFRLRKSTPIEISSRDGKIHFPAALFIQ